MKTLDEVIEQFEKQMEKGQAKILCVGTLDSIPDALHYLKEYRDKHEEMLQMEEALGYCEMADNRPLTWDELKTMAGKPVWIEFLNDEGEWNGEWCLVESSNDILCEILRCKMTWWGLRKITLGKTWQAYRKERS